MGSAPRINSYSSFRLVTWRCGRQSIYSQPMREEVSPLNAASNLLEHSASSYLRSARHQPVRWHPWGEAAFARAQAEDKPILLDIGAVWCHWCHVMDRESYENPQLAALINKLFVAVKVELLPVARHQVVRADRRDPERTDDQAHAGPGEKTQDGDRRSHV